MEENVEEKGGYRAPMAMPIATAKFKFSLGVPPPPPSPPPPPPPPPSSLTMRRRSLKPPHCAPAPVQEMQEQIDVGIMCEPCNGKGWLLCDFCNGQKTNVKAANNRIYRRCPTCRAIGYVLCSKCKVFKCVTFPNYDDGEKLNF